MNYPKIAGLKSVEEFRRRIEALGLDLSVDEELLPAPDGPLAQGLRWGNRRIGNRFSILPMEGWDGTLEGGPTDLTRRRWARFGRSGAKLIWGGEAVAVRHDGRANPNQLILNRVTIGGIAGLREELRKAHAEIGDLDDLVIGLQLTHSGRFARPDPGGGLQPRVAYRHPLLDGRFGVKDDRALFTDDELDALSGDFIDAAVLAAEAGFDFVDIKHCHGYLGHELLSAVTRPGRYGGSLENRTRFLRTIVDGIRRVVPGLGIGVRLSLFDQLPWKRGADGVGVASEWQGEYPHAFGADRNEPGRIAWEEPLRLFRIFAELGIQLVCLSCGSPYYNPHIQRPASVPPSDGYLPPEDPLAGVARQIAAVGHAKAANPDLIVVGSGYSYLQEWLPRVAQAQVRLGKTDLVGLGRMVLSYPELPLDVLSGQELQRRRICRTFSECTTGPRMGLVSGCFPLDDFYKGHPDAERLRQKMGGSKV
jgi:2,4-dienoyl-CoA reductase-like NADH-dependent reductase (Old Yellow Enzyme family)